MTKRRKVTHRTAERLSRAAYEYEALAVTLRNEKYGSTCESVAYAARLLGEAGRMLAHTLKGGADE